MYSALSGPTDSKLRYKNYLFLPSCSQNSGEVSRIIRVITIEQAYVVTTIQA